MIYRVLIVGLGNIGMGYDLSNSIERHIKTHSRAFHLHDGFDLLASVDPSETARNTFEANYKCKSYAKLETALLEQQPDVIVIATPTHLHLEDVQIIIENSLLRAILCEKPLAMNLKECSEIIELCSNNNIDLYVNYIRRTDPAVIEIKSMLDAGLIEKPTKSVVRYSKGFLHNGSHFFEMFNFWLGDMVSSQILNLGVQLPTGDSEPDVHVKFKDGEVTFLSIPDEKLSYSSVVLLSPSGRLTYEEGGNKVKWYPVKSNSKVNVIAAEPLHIQSDLVQYQFNVAEHLFNALENKENNLCTGKRAFKIIEQMRAVLENKKI